MLDGNKHEVIAGEGTTLHIPERPTAATPNAGSQAQATAAPTSGFGPLFAQLGNVMESQTKVLVDQGAKLGAALQKNMQAVAPTTNAQPAAVPKDTDPFALPPQGSFGQLGKVMEIHATFSRQLAPGVPAVHYFSQYRGLGAGMEGGVSWGGEIAVYGLPSDFAEASSWKGVVYPAGHMTFGWDRLSVYATSKESALALMENESAKDRMSFPP
jgi:hypothetical protein